MSTAVGRHGDAVELIVFRVDASAIIGTGHVMRCLTLAIALRAQGRNVRFICREHAGHLCNLIETRGFPVTRLPSSEAEWVRISADERYGSWLGTSWQADAEQTRGAIEAMGATPGWLIVDHYGIDARWERVLRPLIKRCLAIDDLADREHACDVLLDQNLVAGMHTRYAGRVPEECALLLGPEYALLQPLYAELHERIPPRAGKIQRMLVFFGGADNANLTGRTITAFLALNRADVALDVVIGSGLPREAEIRRQIEGHDNIRLHQQLPSLAHLMVQADLAIGAGGATSWERLCLGLPALVITLAENQRPNAEQLQRAGLVCWLGDEPAADLKTLTRALSEALEQGVGEQWSASCFAAVDGKGVRRVGAALTVNSTTPLLARFATPRDEDLILGWANDPVTRRNGFSAEPIPAGTHRGWFRARLRELETSRFFILQTEDEVPVGQVRFDKLDAVWRINYALAPQFRGRGCGRNLLDTALAKLHAEFPGAPVFGQVKEGNLPSHKVFAALGFQSRPGGADWVEYVLGVN